MISDNTMNSKRNCHAVNFAAFCSILSNT
jgi:hypothetical protein